MAKLRKGNFVMVVDEDFTYTKKGCVGQITSVRGDYAFVKFSRKQEHYHMDSNEREWLDIEGEYATWRMPLNRLVKFKDAKNWKAQIMERKIKTMWERQRYVQQKVIDS